MRSTLLHCSNTAKRARPPPGATCLRPMHCPRKLPQATSVKHMVKLHLGVKQAGPVCTHIQLVQDQVLKRLLQVCTQQQQGRDDSSYLRQHPGAAEGWLAPITSRQQPAPGRDLNASSQKGGVRAAAGGRPGAKLSSTQHTGYRMRRPS